MSSSLNPSKKIYVDLDCLLDTRLGTLVTISPDFAFEATSSKDYYLREQDAFTAASFGPLTREEFKRVHDALPQQVLKNSLMTKMPHFIRELSAQLVVRNIGTPYAMNVEIEVNTYPYAFSPEEAQTLLQVCAYRLGERFSVSLTHRSYKELALSTVRDAYVAMIMYSYHEWVNFNDLEIKKKPLKELSLYVPKLYFGEPPTAEQLQTFAEHNTGPFELSQQVLAPLVLIQYLPIALYCVDTPNNPG